MQQDIFFKKYGLVVLHLTFCQLPLLMPLTQRQTEDIVRIITPIHHYD
jgi:hypothetical protein